MMRQADLSKCVDKAGDIQMTVAVILMMLMNNLTKPAGKTARWADFSS